MTKKQRKVAKNLLRNIATAKTEEYRAESVRTYSIFMSECREQEKHGEEKKNQIEEAVSKTISRIAHDACQSERNAVRAGQSEFISHSYSE